MKTLLAVIAALCVPACAQMPNAVKVCNEGCTITAMPVGTVYQFGTGSTWVPSTSTVLKLPFLVSYTAFPFDPAPYVVKEFDVQQQAKAFTVTYTVNGVQTVKTIPALPTYKFTCTGTGTVTGTTLTSNNLSCTGVQQ